MTGRILHALGRAAARIRFNTVSQVQIDGVPHWAKERLATAPLRVMVGNAYARVIGLPLRMLPEGAWLEYESRAVVELIGERAPLRRGRQLLLLHARGVALKTLLANSNAEPKPKAVALAARALARLHQRAIRHPLSGREQPFSHADATPGNVTVDLEHDTATWLDFETVHPPHMPAPERHADDLRTLLCGLTPNASPEELPSLCRAALEAYADATVSGALRALLREWQRRPHRRRLAMPEPTESQWACLLEVTRA